jgi:hypothetical protein
VRRTLPYHRRIDAGILAAMVVPPPAYENDDAADEPLARDRDAVERDAVLRSADDARRDERRARRVG